jgi:hypothetical protein
MSGLKCALEQGLLPAALPEYAEGGLLQDREGKKGGNTFLHGCRKADVSFVTE